MKDLEKDYPLIPMDKIDSEAMEIAVRWVESEVREMNNIQNKHKLASDLMNYARRKNDELQKKYDILKSVDDQWESLTELQCPECLDKVSQDELDMFGGLCEECNLDK